MSDSSSPSGAPLRTPALFALDPERLRRELESSRPHLFSPATALLSSEQVRAIRASVEAIGIAASGSAYREAALARAPAIARLDFGPRGAFMGFDFHLCRGGPRLIEINTNAGGAFLAAALSRAQSPSIASGPPALPDSPLASLDSALLSMIEREWRLQRGSEPIGLVAIVDDDPESQYLYPEFRLFGRLLARLGSGAAIADAKDLRLRGGRLWLGESPVSMICNRLTDFYLEDPAHLALRQACEAGAVVLTPHPRAHALFADKRNLEILGDARALSALGIPEPVRESLLASIPKTETIRPERSEELWARRRSLFFKPAAGFGGKAAYRGDKITRRAFGEMLSGGCVAQEYAPPSLLRSRRPDGSEADLKLDVRAYAYDGSIQLLAARLYEGQTTNFRTPGGGFAPVALAP